MVAPVSVERLVCEGERVEGAGGGKRITVAVVTAVAVGVAEIIAVVGRTDSEAGLASVAGETSAVAGNWKWDG